MNKIIERIGTQPQKFNFLFTVTSFKPKISNKDSRYRICLKRQDKVFYSNYFKVDSTQTVYIKENVKFSATMFYNKKEQEYQSKMFILLRCDKEKEVESSKHQIDLEEVIINYHIKKVYEDRFSVLEVDVTGEGAKESLSPVRKSCPQPQQKSYNTISTIEKNLIKHKEKEKGQTKWYTQKNYQPIQLIRFDDYEDNRIESQGPVRNTVNIVSTGMMSLSKQKQVSFRNVKVTEDENRSKQKDRRRQERRKSRQNLGIFNSNPSTFTSKSNQTNETVIPITPHRKPVIHTPLSFQTNLQQKLNQIEDQLGEERLRKSTIYENMNQEKDEIINKLKDENSMLNASVNKYFNELEFSNKEVKNLEGRYEGLYKKMNKLIEQHREIREQKERLVSQNAELLSNISNMKNNITLNAKNTRSAREIKSDIQNKNNIEIQKLNKQIQKYKKSNRRLDEQVQALEAEKLLVEGRYEQILKKYKIISGELSSEKIRTQEVKKKMEQMERQHIKQLKRRQEQIIVVKRSTKDLELKLMNPGNELNKKEHQLLKQKMERMQIKISEDTKENKQLQLFFKKQIQKYKKENIMLYEKMNVIEKSYTDQMNISVNRQKSLNKALTEKDKKLSQQTKQLTKMKQILAENNKFIESQKVDLIMKMRVLNEQLTKRKQVSEQLELSEYKNKQLKNKVKMLTSSNQEAEVELQRLRQEVSLSENKIKDHNSALSLVQQLQGQLVKLNMKIANIMQMIFQNDPGLAQTIIENIRQL